LVSIRAEQDAVSGSTLSEVSIQAVGASGAITRAINVGTELEEITVTSGNSTGGSALVDAAGTGGIQATATGSLSGTISSFNTAINTLDTGAAVVTNVVSADADGAAAATSATASFFARVNSPLGTATSELGSSPLNDGVNVVTIGGGTGHSSNTVSIAPGAITSTVNVNEITGASATNFNAGTGDMTGVTSGAVSGGDIVTSFTTTNTSDTASAEAVATFVAVASGGTAATIATANVYAATTSTAGVGTFNLNSDAAIVGDSVVNISNIGAAGDSTVNVSNVTSTGANSVLIGNSATSSSNTVEIANSGNDNTVQIGATGTGPLDFDVGNAGSSAVLTLTSGTSTTEGTSTGWVVTFPTKHFMQSSQLDRNGAVAAGVVRQEVSSFYLENQDEGNVAFFSGTGNDAGTATNNYQVSVVSSDTPDVITSFTNTGAASNPTAVTTGSGTYSVGEVLLVTDPGGSTLQENRGLFVVVSHTLTALVLDAAPGAGFEFFNNQVTTQSSITATVRRATITAMRTDTTGEVLVARAFNDIGTASYVNIVTSGGTLADAVANLGASSATQGSVSGSDFLWNVNDTETLGWGTVTGSHNLISLAPAVGADGVTILDNEAGSTFTSNAAINVVTTGISIDGGTAANEFTIGLTSAGGTANAIETPAGSLTIGSSNTGPGGSATTVRTPDTGGAGVTGNVAVFAGINSNSGTTGGTVTVNGSDYSAGSDVLNGSGAVTVRGGDDTAGNLATGANVTVRGGVAIDGGDAFFIGGAAFAAGAGDGGDSNIDAGAGDGAGVDGNVNIGVTNALNVNIAATTEVDVTTALFDVNTTGATTVNAGAASNFTTSAGAITVDAEAAGITIDAGGGDLDLSVTSEGSDVNISTVNMTAGGTPGTVATTAGNATGTAGDVGGAITGTAGTASLGLIGAVPVTAGIGGGNTAVAGVGGGATGSGTVLEGSDAGVGGVMSATGGKGGNGDAAIGVGLAGVGGAGSFGGGDGGDGSGAGVGEVAANGATGGTGTVFGGTGGDGAVGGSADADAGAGGDGVTVGGAGGAGVAGGVNGAGGDGIVRAGAEGGGGGTPSTAGIVRLQTATSSVVTGITVVANLENDGAGANGGGRVSTYVYDTPSALALPTHAALTGSLSHNCTSNGSDKARLYFNNGNGISTTTSTDWVEVLTTATGTTRGYFTDTFNTTITSGTTITTGELTLGVLPVKPTVEFNFPEDSEFFLNGVRLVAGAAASGEDVENAAGNTFVLNQNASSGDRLIVIYNTGTQLV
jgi:hypothetical protein